MSLSPELPLPPHYDPATVGQVWRVPYAQRAADAEQWAQGYALRPAAEDVRQIALVIIDAQNTFCIPEYELFVGGRSGTGAVDDNRRLSAFIYHNLGRLTQIIPTLDTHHAAQIFHALFLVNERGEHPAPYSLVTVEDVEQGTWRFNAALAPQLGLTPTEGQTHLVHYVQALKQRGKYALTIWPYHALLGGLGHALVSAIEEAVFFHSLARQTWPHWQIKGQHPLTENYSALGPEVQTNPSGAVLAPRNTALIEQLLQFDAIVIAGQAKSHCVAWTVQDLLDAIVERDARLARKVYLLEDCTSPVVVPGVIDYTEDANAAFSKFAEAGMNLVRSTDPMEQWLNL